VTECILYDAYLFLQNHFAVVDMTFMLPSALSPNVTSSSKDMLMNNFLVSIRSQITVLVLSK